MRSSLPLADPRAFHRGLAASFQTRQTQPTPEAAAQTEPLTGAKARRAERLARVALSVRSEAALRRHGSRKSF